MSRLNFDHQAHMVYHFFAFIGFEKQEVPNVYVLNGQALAFQGHASR